MADADILLYVTDVVEDPEKNMDFLEKVSKMSIPVILLINKIDESDQKTLGNLVTKWHGLLPNAEILPISAKNKFGVDILLKRVHELLPESPAFFDKDQLTDKPAKFFVSEIIREKILRYMIRKSLILLRLLLNASRKMTARFTSVLSFMWNVAARKELLLAIRVWHLRRCLPKLVRAWNVSSIRRYSLKLS